MLWQWIVVGALVVAAAWYVFRRLAPPRWLWWLGIGRRGGRGAGPGAAAAGGTGARGGGCGCGDCPTAPRVRRPGH